MQNTLENTSLRCPNPLLIHHGKRWNMYFLSLKINLCNVSMCAQVYNVHQVLADVHRGQKRTPDALELEL